MRGDIQTSLVFDVDASELENLPRKTTVDLYGCVPEMKSKLMKENCCDDVQFD